MSSRVKVDPLIYPHKNTYFIKATLHDDKKELAYIYLNTHVENLTAIYIRLSIKKIFSNWGT